MSYLRKKKKKKKEILLYTSKIILMPVLTIKNRNFNPF